MNCRSDCVSLVSLNFCLLIDGNFSLSRRMEDFLAEFSFEGMEKCGEGKISERVIG
jgi:hypothetical protein